MKKIMVPVARILMGTGAAFASKAAKEERTMVSPTYRIDADTGFCVAVDQPCSDINNVVCTWSGDGVSQLHDAPLSPTECGRVLYKP